jgi:hypothetical protein
MALVHIHSHTNTPVSHATLGALFKVHRERSYRWSDRKILRWCVSPLAFVNISCKPPIVMFCNRWVGFYLENYPSVTVQEAKLKHWRLSTTSKRPSSAFIEHFQSLCGSSFFNQTAQPVPGIGAISSGREIGSELSSGCGLTQAQIGIN